MSLANLNPVRTRRTVQDQVYDQLREALVAGAFEAGESFTISSLAQRFETSHMPVREALRRLAAENALRISASGTAVVPALDLVEMGQICQARRILEPATAELAFGHIDKAIRLRMSDLIETHRRGGEEGDIPKMLDANRRFHFLIYELSGNPVLVSQIENLWLRSGAYVRFLSDQMIELVKTSYRGAFVVHHETMLNAVEAGNLPAFRQAVEDDIIATHELVRGILERDD